MGKKKTDDSTEAAGPLEKITVVATQEQPRYACYGKFCFTREAQEVEVNEDELEEIEADLILTVIRAKPTEVA